LVTIILIDLYLNNESNGCDTNTIGMACIEGDENGIYFLYQIMNLFQVVFGSFKEAVNQ
jgi:hypothetical protein